MCCPYKLGQSTSDDALAGVLLCVGKRYARSKSSVPSNRKPAKRLRFEKEEQRRERAPTYKISRSKRYIACSDVVPVVGLEPTRSRPRRILNPLRLPFHHTGRCNRIIILRCRLNFKGFPPPFRSQFCAFPAAGAQSGALSRRGPPGPLADCGCGPTGKGPRGQRKRRSRGSLFIAHETRSHDPSIPSGSASTGTSSVSLPAAVTAT